MEPKLIDNRSSKEIPLQEFPFSIGRSGCNWNIPTEGVSEKHVSIYLEGGKFFIEDRGSATGTYLNNRLLEKKTQLRDGQTIKIAVTDKWPAGVKDLTFKCEVDPLSDFSVEDLDILQEDDEDETDQERIDARHLIYHVSSKGFLKATNRHRVPLEKFFKDRILFQTLVPYKVGDKLLMDVTHPHFEPERIQLELSVLKVSSQEKREYQIVEASVVKADPKSNQLIFSRVQLSQ